MFGKSLMALAATAVIASTQPALAARQTVNPMTPRQLSSELYSASYDYGLPMLAGRSLDPLEPLNRYVGWTFNYDILDRFILRPTARAYSLLPDGVRTGVGNFLANLDEVNSTVNHLVVLEPGASAKSLSRFVINSTIGLLGIFDVATMMGIERDELRMKTVLGRLGADGGAYLMVPLLTPGSMRDVQGNLIDSAPYYFTPVWFNLAVRAVSAVHIRSGLLEQDDLVRNALDPYVQMRDILLQYAEGEIDPNASTRVDETETIDQQFLDEIDE